MSICSNLILYSIVWIYEKLNRVYLVVYFELLEHRNVCKIVDNFIEHGNPMFGSSMFL